jgi:hypothetical protein
MKTKILAIFAVAFIYNSINCYETKSYSKKSSQSYACSQHGKNCNGNHNRNSKKR